MAFSALLDTCVLVPSRARDVLLEIASSGVFRLLWSSRILLELDYAIHKFNEEKGIDQQDAMVADWERVESTINLPDLNDRHVVAAALIGRADVIVMDNTKDFPASELPRPLPVQTLDYFRRTSAPGFGAAAATLLD